jgi:hypothetical protein
MTAVQVSPQRLLLSGWLLTNVQVNITKTLYDTGHTCIYITLALLFMFFFSHLFHFSRQAGCPPFPLSATLTIWQSCYSNCYLMSPKRLRFLTLLRKNPYDVSEDNISIISYMAFMHFASVF